MDRLAETPKTACYTIDFSKNIGHGSFATVYRGRMKNNGREVGVKVSNTERGIEAARLEVHILQRLKDANATNIVQLIGSFHQKATGSRQETFSFAMELADFSLDKLMREKSNIGGLDHPVLIDLMVDCASALNSLKELNIVHRDIKHLNILVFRTPARGRKSTYLFKFCDFGGANVMQADHNDMSTLVGTPNCLHPKLATELAKGQHRWKIDDRYNAEECDCWSLGCTLFFAATGRYPFPHSADYNLYHSATKGLPKGAISASLKEGLPIYEFNYQDKILNEKYPIWFRHCLGTVISMLFHSPSLDQLQNMSKVLRECKEVELLVPSQLSRTTYVDFRNEPLFGTNYPSLRDTLKLNPDEPCTFISSSNISHLSMSATYITLDPSQRYLTYIPGRIPSKNWSSAPSYEVFINTDDSTSRNKRVVVLAEAFQALQQANGLVELFGYGKDILIQNIQTLRASAIAIKNSAAVPLRFAHYANSLANTLLYTKPNDKDRALGLIRNTDRNIKEFTKHSNHLDQIVRDCDEISKKLKNLELDDEEIPGIDGELTRYLDVGGKEEFELTAPYTRKLVESCFMRRNTVADSLCTDAGPLETFQKTTEKVLNSLADLTMISDAVDECTIGVERPFQELKASVESINRENSITPSKVRRVCDLMDVPNRLSIQAATNNQLARKLEEQLGSILRMSDSTSSSSPNHSS